MKAVIKKIEVLKVDLPFKKPFKHSLHTRSKSNSVFVKLFLENGITGFGESLPRDYVTCETTDSVFKKLKQIIPGKVIGVKISSFKHGLRFLANLKELQGAARCCLEVAILDGLGKFFNTPFTEITGRHKRAALFSTGVISAGSVLSATKTALGIKALGFKCVKVKVGAGNDLKRLAVVRNILGNKVDVRVDANCAWEADEAIRKIKKMRKFGISCVEQPVRSYDIRGLKKVTNSVPETIIADESLTTVKDAEKFARIKACDMFNIRLSKCGGVLNALKIADIARHNSIKIQLGCQVGESGVLAAAGRHFACGVKEVEYYEGSYGKFLLKEDLTKENMTMGFGGRARPINGPGLGITVKEKILDKYTIKRAGLE